MSLLKWPGAQDSQDSCIIAPYPHFAMLWIHYKISNLLSFHPPIGSSLPRCVFSRTTNLPAASVSCKHFLQYCNFLFNLPFFLSQTTSKGGSNKAYGNNRPSWLVDSCSLHHIFKTRDAKPSSHLNGDISLGGAGVGSARGGLALDDAHRLCKYDILLWEYFSRCILRSFFIFHVVAISHSVHFHMRNATSHWKPVAHHAGYRYCFVLLLLFSFDHSGTNTEIARVVITEYSYQYYGELCARDFVECRPICRRTITGGYDRRYSHTMHVYDLM